MIEKHINIGEETLKLQRCLQEKGFKKEAIEAIDRLADIWESANREFPLGLSLSFAKKGDYSVFIARRVHGKPI